MRIVAFGEADSIVTAFTEHLGLVPILARRARAGLRHWTLVLEPMHTLHLELADPPSSELLKLRSVSISLHRPRLIANLTRLQAAGRALRWLRDSAPLRTPDARLWTEATSLLDVLDADVLSSDPLAPVAEFGARMLGILGYALSLDRCVSCGKSCEPGRPAFVDPCKGGLVCRQCGGAGLLIDGDTRDRLASATEGTHGVLSSINVAIPLEIVDSALRCHVGPRSK